MSIFTCILSLFVVADDEFWTFFPRIAPLCPFSAQALAFSSILWLVFGYFCFLMLPYVHFHLQPFTFRGRRRWILDFFPKNCGIISIFTCILSLFMVADNEFWTFFSRFATLCPFLLASFHFSWSLAINFGLFSQELLHYVHFRHRHLRFLQYCDLFLDIFASWCFLISIFTCILSLFVVADDEFWTFFSRFATLCPFSA